MALSKLHRQEIMNNLLYEIGRNVYYGQFSVNSFAETHKLSKQSIYRYLNVLEKESKIEKLQGKGGYRLVDSYFRFQLSIEGLKEDIVWSRSIYPLVRDMPEIALKNSTYAFCEMLNNAIDHSEGTDIKVIVVVNAFCASFSIIDNGVGIFTKIAAAMDFEEKRFAVLELAKGKFTTDPDSHSGEGIFFSAKASDIFGIFSDDLVFLSVDIPGKKSEKLFDYKHMQASGTTVLFTVFRDHSVSTLELFNRYTNEPDHYGFTKTVVPVRLLEHGDPNPTFVSRSQAKRLLARFERFERVELDFTDVDEIGQGFADEVFRVFQVSHPNSQIVAINCNPQVDAMIKHVSRH